MVKRQAHHLKQLPDPGFQGSPVTILPMESEDLFKNIPSPESRIQRSGRILKYDLRFSTKHPKLPSIHGEDIHPFEEDLSTGGFHETYEAPGKGGLS
jgi:hypothetical protein